MKKILVIQLKQIGDVLLSSPICNTLKTNYPDAQIDYIIYDYTFGVVENNPNIDNFLKITNKERESKLEFFKFLMRLPKPIPLKMNTILEARKNTLIFLFTKSQGCRIYSKSMNYIFLSNS